MFQKVLILSAFLIFHLSVSAKVTVETFSDFEGIEIPEDIIFERVQIEDNQNITTGIQCRHKSKTTNDPSQLYGHGFTSTATFWLNHLIAACRKGQQAFSLNQMGHGSESDGIGKSRSKNPAQSMESFEFFPNHLENFYRHVLKSNPGKKIVYHGHSMGHMMYEVFASGFIKDPVSGEEKVDLKRKNWVTQNTDSAVLYGGPTDLRSLKLLNLIQKMDDKAVKLMNSALKAQSDSKRAQHAENLKTHMMDVLKKNGLTYLKPVLNLFVGKVVNLNNLSPEDLDFLMRFGSSDGIAPGIIKSMLAFADKAKGFVSPDGTKYHQLKNNDIPQLIIFGEKDMLASSAKGVKNFIENRPSENQLVLVLKDFSHLDLAFGEAYLERVQPLIDQFKREGITDNLLSQIKNTPSMSYIRGGNNNKKCLPFVKSALTSGQGKFRLSTRDVQRLLDNAVEEVK